MNTTSSNNVSWYERRLLLQEYNRQKNISHKNHKSRNNQLDVEENAIAHFSYSIATLASKK